MLNINTYNKFFAHIPLDPPSADLCGYGSSKITVVGTLQLPVHYGTTHLPSFTFHISKRGAKLLGLDLFTGLGLTMGQLYFRSPPLGSKNGLHSLKDWTV